MLPTKLLFISHWSRMRLHAHVTTQTHNKHREALRDYTPSHQHLRLVGLVAVKGSQACGEKTYCSKGAYGNQRLTSELALYLLPCRLLVTRRRTWRSLQTAVFAHVSLSSVRVSVVDFRTFLLLDDPSGYDDSRLLCIMLNVSSSRAYAFFSLSYFL